MAATSIVPPQNGGKPENLSAGVHKFNADTDLRHAFRKGFEQVWAQGDRQLEDAMAEGRARMVDATVEKIRSYGCDGRAALAGAAEGKQP